MLSTLWLAVSCFAELSKLRIESLRTIKYAGHTWVGSQSPPKYDPHNYLVEPDFAIQLTGVPGTIELKLMYVPPRTYRDASSIDWSQTGIVVGGWYRNLCVP